MATMANGRVSLDSNLNDVFVIFSEDMLKEKWERERAEANKFKSK